MTAALFAAAGAEAAFGERRGDFRPDPVRWAPLVAAPLAIAAQAARALMPNDTTRTVAHLANGVALGVGAAGLASSVQDVMSEREFTDEFKFPSVAPLAFGAIGLLAILLDSEDGTRERVKTKKWKREKVKKIRQREVEDQPELETGRPRGASRHPVRRIIIRV